MDMNPQEWRSNELLIDAELMERMVKAVGKVRDRLHRSTRALQEAGIPYALIGGNAVAAWVARVDESAVRNTPDVDILLKRDDLEAAKAALSSVGFVFQYVKGIDMFLDGRNAEDRDAVHINFARERVRAGDIIPAPEISESEADHVFQVVALESLVKMKLTSFRDKDRTHLRDLIGVELLDETWLPRLPAELSSRLKELLDNPEG
jgi:hypothetical protein